MNYDLKYKKYQKKYQDLKNSLGGGMIERKLRYLIKYLMSKINKLNSNERKKLKQALQNNIKYTDQVKLEDLNNEINNNIYVEKEVKDLSDDLVYNTITKEDALKRGHPEWEGMEEVMLGGGDMHIYALVYLSMLICKLYRKIDPNSSCALYMDLMELL